MGSLLSIVARLLSGPPGANPTITDIEEIDILQEELKKRDAAAKRAKEEAERSAKEAEASAQRVQEAKASLRAAEAQEERVRKEAEDARVAAEAKLAAAAERATQQAKEFREATERAHEAERAKKRADTCRVAAEQAAEVERNEARKREQELEKTARKVEEAAQEELLRQRHHAEEEIKRAAEAQRLAEEAARKAADEARVAQEKKAQAEQQLRDGIQPVVMPSRKELAEFKRKYQYREGLYHFAVAGVAGSGKSSLINALRGLRNRDKGAAAAGITETTLLVTRYPDPNPKYPIVWFDIPGAGTLKIPDWQYFNSQGLYVFDALIVLSDNRFTATDIAIIRNAGLFHIPCYIVRSKADCHIQNVMLDLGSEEEGVGPEGRAEIESEAREHFVTATRQTVRENLLSTGLPEQRVYIVSNSAMLSVVKDNVTPKLKGKLIDELILLQDLLEEAHHRRAGRVSKLKKALCLTDGSSVYHV